MLQIIIIIVWFKIFVLRILRVNFILSLSILQIDINTNQNSLDFIEIHWEVSISGDAYRVADLGSSRARSVDRWLSRHTSEVYRSARRTQSRWPVAVQCTSSCRCWKEESIPVSECTASRPVHVWRIGWVRTHLGHANKLGWCWVQSCWWLRPCPWRFCVLNEKVRLIYVICYDYVLMVIVELCYGR